ncbi:MAG: T9SS type A sorting domain-containing protein, partial [Lewinella sp.]|nr:T9SS type A sorting domain-containing protein [Lewinella sp.]
PTCDDGIQNGDEEGVDCGGSYCDVCPTCDDGIQNGDELGVDCGGSCGPCPCEDGTVSDDDFETSFGIWNDGGSDCSRYLNADYASSGSYSIRLRDGTITSVTTTNVLDLSAVEDVVFDFTFYARSMEAGEGFELEMSSDGGSSFSTVASWYVNVDFSNNEFYDYSIVMGSYLSDETVFRFSCHGSSNTDWVHLDDIVIYGCLPVGPEMMTRPAAPVVETPASTFAELSLFPNPTVDLLQVKFTAQQDERVELVVTDFAGRTIQRQPLDASKGANSAQVNTENFTGGVYYLHLITNEGRTTERFVVIKQ